MGSMRLVTIKIPEIYLEGLDELVKKGRYSTRSEAIRVAIRELLMRELWQRQNGQNGNGLTSFESAVREVVRKLTVG